MVHVIAVNMCGALTTGRTIPAFTSRVSHTDPSLLDTIEILFIETNFTGVLS